MNTTETLRFTLSRTRRGLLIHDHKAPSRSLAADLKVLIGTLGGEREAMAYAERLLAALQQEPAADATQAERFSIVRRRDSLNIADSETLHRGLPARVQVVLKRWDSEASAARYAEQLVERLNKMGSAI